MSSEKKNIVGMIGSVMFIMLIGKLLGFAREIFLTSYFGAGTVESGAYNTASIIPNVFLDVAFASAISSSFIPVFNSYLAKNRAEAFRVASNFINVLLTFSIAVTVILMIFSPAVTDIVAGSLNAETKSLTAGLLRVMLPAIVLGALTFSLIGVLQSLNEFNIPAAVSVLYNLAIIVYYLFFIDFLGVYGLAAAVLIGWVLQILVQLPYLRKKGYRHSAVFKLRDEGFRRIIKLSLPVLVSSWLLPINLIVNFNAATRLFDGLSLGSDVLRYAYNLYSVITGVIILSISNVVFQRMSKQRVVDDGEGFSATVRQSLRVLIFILVPLSVGLIVLGKPLIELLYERRNFDSATTVLTYDALKFFAIGMLGFGFQTILSRGFYAGNNGRVPMLSSIAGIALNALLSYILVEIIGVGGPALASSIAISAAAVIMLVVMYIKNKRCLDKGMIGDSAKILISTAVMAVLVYAAYSLLGGGLFALILCVVGGASVYAALCYILRVTEMRLAVQMIMDFIETRHKSEN